MGMTVRRDRRGPAAAWPLAVASATALAVILAVQSTAAGVEPFAPSATPGAVSEAGLPTAGAVPATPAPLTTTPPVPAPPRPVPAAVDAAPAPIASPAQAPAGVSEPSPAPTPAAPMPAPTADAGPTAPAAATPSPVPEAGTPTPTPPATPGATPAPGAPSGAAIGLARLPDTADTAPYLPPGEDATGAQPFDTFRLGVLVTNPSPTPFTWTPQVEFRRLGDPDFAALPAQATPGVALHAAQEWRHVTGGTTPAATTVALATGHLPVPDGLAAALGRRVSGANPDAPATLAPGSAAEQEFTVRLGLDALAGATYEVRITDAGVPLAGEPVARIVLGGAADVVTAPGQRSGVAAAPRYPLVLSRAAAAAAASEPEQLTGVRVVPDGTATSVHQRGAGQCATCHSTHSSSSLALIKAPDQSAQCATCHGAAGLGGAADTASQFAQGQPNDEQTRSYYSHDLTAAGHRLAGDDEFTGRLNRHSQCADCHDPHSVSKAAPYGTAGVAVTNGPAGTAPAYERVATITAEYQLCLTCHSGATQQLPNDPARPSRDRTDLGVALNPNNRSYHPVEAPGRNQSQKMADSLAGTSRYKLWDLTTADTVRCVMCHTSGTTPAGTATDATLPVHASENRAILVRPYESRTLSAKGTVYDPAGFALCLTCHAETPYMNRSGAGAQTATNFDFHGLHTSGIATRGSGGTDIDTAGAGQGNARCAECHFRSHGPSDTPGDQRLSGDGLVTFSPNVTRSVSMAGSPVTFVKTATGGTCTLTCHGKDHQSVGYTSP